MFPYGASRSNFDLNGKTSRDIDHHRPGLDLASMDGYRPYPGPSRPTTGRSLQDYRHRDYEERYPRDKLPEREPEHGNKYFLNKFAERTSLQGIPYIHAVRRTYRKLSWALLFVVMTFVTFAHLGLLIYTYLQFDTSSSVEFNRANLRFPTVTVCNLNPIVLSLLPNTSAELLAIQQNLDPNDRRRKKRQTSPGQNLNAGFLGNASGIPLLDENNLEFDDDGEFSDDATYGNGEVAPASRILGTFYYYMGLLSRGEREEYGHDNNLILDCIFNGRVCQTAEFHPFLSREYGNCFSFNSKNEVNKTKSYQSIKSGYNLGLQLILFTQNSEYLKGFTTAKGIKVTPHEYGTMPNLDTGLSLTPGFETFIGMKMKVVTRRDKPYGRCGDYGAFKKRFEGKYEYSLDACLNVCKHKLIYETCGCYQGEYLEFYSDTEVNNAKTGVCDTQTEFNCTKKISDANNPCDCHQGCNETHYQVDVSTNYWPALNKWDDLRDLVCENYGLMSPTCQSLKNQTDAELALRNNFLKLNVYYEDLTAEIIKQDPSYSPVQFVSDVGGVFGLWIGASILSLCEVVDLFVSICSAWCCRRDRSSYNRRRRSRYVTEFDGDRYRGNPRPGYGGKRGPADAEWGAPPPF